MKLAVIWHLIGVLLIDVALATVIGSEEEAATSASTSTTTAVRAPPVVVARERKLPRLDHVNGLKKIPPKSEILVQQQQNSPDESTSTTSRSFRPDYLAAKNTVPVAVAPTEATFRKFSRPRLIPGPSPALLAVKAASASSSSSSTTERGLDSSIPPTGWALAALGPSSRGTTGFGGKRFSSPSTNVKPISTFWSTRLLKTTTSSTFPEMLDLQDEPNNATTVRPQSDNEESLEENIGTTASTPPTTTTTSTTTTTTSSSTPITTVTVDADIENSPPVITPVNIYESTDSAMNVTMTSTFTTTNTTTSSTTPMTSTEASTVPPSSTTTTTTVLPDNLIKQLQYASNEINGTTISTSTTTDTTTRLPVFKNRPEENTIATPMAKSNKLEEPLESTKSENRELISTTTPKMEEMTVGTTTTIGKTVASPTEIPALVVTTTPVEETTVVTVTDQTLTTVAKSNSTSKIITVVNETVGTLMPTVVTTTPLPSSTLSNDIPDVANSGKKPPVVVNSTETADNYIPVSTPVVRTEEDLNVINRSTVSPSVHNISEYSSGVNGTTVAVETTTETLNHSRNEIKPLEVDNKIDRVKQIQPKSSTPSTTTDSTTSQPHGHAVTNLDNFHYDLDNKTETPAIIINEGGGSGSSGSDEDDDTLKYNVTGGTHHEDGHPDDYDDFDQVSVPPLLINVTTEKPVETAVNDTNGTVTTTTVSTSPSTVVTTVSIVTVSETTTYVFDHTIPGEDEDDEESVIVPMNVRVHIQASYKQMCLAKEIFRNTIVSALSEETTKPVERDQVEILNLGPNECDGLMSTDGDVIPINLLLMTPQGKYDRSLTEILFNLIKHGRLNFKFPITQVDKLVSQMLEPPVHQMGGTVILAIVISSIAGVCLLFLTILIVIMRKRQKGFNYGQRCTPVSLDDYSLDNISVCNSVRRKAMRASKRSYGNPAFDDPVALTNPLNFAGLANAIGDKSKIEEEFDRVPVVSMKPDELPSGAETKNRYANVIPLPETRVQLNGASTISTGNDDADHFINANYVKGPKGADKFYIACQAPLQNTVADFWQMIWEQQSRVIIMLTDLHENGVEKSADYLPPSEVLDCHRVFGDLQVTLKKREVRDKYVISSLQLKNLVSNLWREVTHLWYSGWPTRGVPDDCSSMIAFLIEARSYSKAGPPVVVHCSPGTGRTGTVIAIDTAIRDYETTRTVDIPKTVYSIRRDRAGAVQTSQQYLFIYQVLHLYATKLAGGGLDSI